MEEHGVYRFYCKYQIELSFLIEQMMPMIKVRQADVHMYWDGAEMMWCLQLEDLGITQSGPF